MNHKRSPRARGLREVATLQTVLHGARPRERHHLVSRFARLENERARLERELEMWTARKSATESTLSKLHEQIETLRPRLLEEETPAVRPEGRPSPAGRRKRPSGKPAGPPRTHNFPIEY